MNDKLGFGNSACDITGSFPSPLTRLECREDLSYYWFCPKLNITTKHMLLVLEHAMECPGTVISKNKMSLFPHFMFI